MRDSRLDTHGGLALIFVLPTKVLVVNELASRGTPVLAAPATACAIGRGMAVLLIHRYRYAREEGPGNVFIGKVTGRQARVTLGLAAIFAAVLLPGMRGVTALIVTIVAIFILGQSLKRTLGEQTGDTLGAATKLGELVFSLALLRVSPHTGTLMQALTSLPRTTSSPDSIAMLRAQQYVDGLLKPPESLRRPESLAVQLAGMPGLKNVPHMNGRATLVMCAGHDVWDEGVTVSPRVVMAIQVANMMRGTTGVCVLAAQVGAKAHVIDVRIDTELIPDMVNMHMARGCGNISGGPTISRSQAEELLLEVIHYAHELTEGGVTLFGVEEPGMANTTPAATIVSVLIGNDIEEVVGIDANLSLSRMGNKVDIVCRAIAVNQPDRHDGVDVLIKVGGLDLIGAIGVMLGAAPCDLPVILDGLLSYPTALAVSQIVPQIKPYLTSSRFSAEKGARTALAHLELNPYPNMGMCSGEGNGATLAIPIIEAACAMYKNVGQFAASSIMFPGGKEA